MSEDTIDDNDIGCDPNDLEAVQARLVGVMGRLEGVLARLHSPEEGERHSALKSALGSFRLINKIGKVLNPLPTDENPQIEYSFPMLYRLADQAGTPQDEAVLEKLEEFAQANEELKAREELLLADRRRLEILLQQSSKGGQSALFAQRDKLKATLSEAEEVIQRFSGGLDTVLTSLQTVLEQGQSEQGIPDLYADWMAAIEETHIPIRSLNSQKQPWYRKRLLKAAGLPVEASEILVMKAMIKAQDAALTSKTSGGLLGTTLERVAEFSQSLAQFRGMVSIMQAGFAAQLEAEVAPEAKELLDLLAKTQKSIEKQNTELEEKTKAVLKMQEERDRAIAERDRTNNCRESDKKNFDETVRLLRQKVEDSALTKKRKRFAERAMAYRVDKRNLNQQLALLNEFLGEVFTPEILARLQSDDVDPKMREDMLELARQNITPEQLSKLIVRGFTLNALERKLKAVFEEHAELKKEAAGWKEMAVHFSKTGSNEAKAAQYIAGMLLCAGGAGLASIGTGNPFSSVIFTGAVAGGLVSGGYNFVRTMIDFDSSYNEDLPKNDIKVGYFSAACHAFKKGLLPGILAGAVGVTAFQFAAEHDVRGIQQVTKKATPLTAAGPAASANDNKIITDPFKAAASVNQSASSPQGVRPHVTIIYSKEFDAYGTLDQLCKNREVRCIKDGAYVLN